MKIDVIYSFEGMPQQKANYPFVINILTTKNNLIDFLLADLSREEKGCLVKISTCIETHLAYPISNNAHKDKKHWFNKCYGKIWMDDLEKYRKLRGIKSTVSPSLIKEFMATNYPTVKNPQPKLINQ